MAEPPDVDATVQRIEELIETLGRAEPQLRGMAEEAIRLLMQLYGTALGRMVETAGAETAARLAEDKLVASLLLLHGLHPVAPEERIRQALHRVERRLDGAHLAVAEVTQDLVRVRVDRNGGSAPPEALAAMIEHAVAESAPEIGGVEIEGLPAASLVQIAPAAVS